MRRIAWSILRSRCPIGRSIRSSYQPYLRPTCPRFNAHPRVDRGMSSEVRLSPSHEELTTTESREQELHRDGLHQVQQGHEEGTATEPRGNDLHEVGLHQVKQGHEERTATEPRGNELHEVVLHSIQRVSSTVRLLELRPRDNQEAIKVCYHALSTTHVRAGFAWRYTVVKDDMM